MLVTLLGITIVVNLLQLPNATLPIVVKLLGRVIDSRFIHHPKDSTPIVVQEEPSSKVTDFNWLALLNA